MYWCRNTSRRFLSVALLLIPSGDAAAQNIRTELSSPSKQATAVLVLDAQELEYPSLVSDQLQPSTTSDTESGTVAGKVYKFALCPKSKSSFFQDAYAGFSDEAAFVNKLGTADGDPQVQPYYIGAPELDATGIMQANFISEALEEMDGLAISIVNKDVMQPVIAEARSRGIPVVTFDSDDPDSARQSYIGTNNTFFGERIGKVLHQIQRKGGKYALLSGVSPNIVERERGIIATLPAIWKLVNVTDMEGNNTYAIEVMRQYAETIPDLAAIVLAYGAPMEEVELWTQFDADYPGILLVSGDDHGPALEYLKMDKVQGLVGQMPYAMGGLSVRSLLSLAEERQIPEIQGTNVLEHLQIPLHLPDPEVNHNYLGSWAAVGFTLFAISTLLCLYFCAWTLRNRKVKVVTVAQPEFLLMVAVGCIIMSSASIPISFDDSSANYTESKGQHICMAFPWLLALGFTIVFSALFAKSWRINRLIRASSQMQRVIVKKSDILLPLSVLMIGNVVTLTVWTVMNPRIYTRLDKEGTDEWNRVIATYGVCQSAGNDVPYMVVLGLLNIGVLLMANYESWRARNVKTVLSESRYIAYAVAVGLEAVLIGTPLLMLSGDSPFTYYLTSVLLNFIVSTAVATLVFIPKIRFTKEFVKMTSAEQSRVLTDAIRTSS